MMPVAARRRLGIGLLLVGLMAGPAVGVAPVQAQTLALSGRTTGLSETRDALLASPDARTITLSDPVYGRTMSYRAVPLAPLLRRLGATMDDYVQARATDAFSVAIPARLLAFDDPARAEAFLAIEEPGAPWPAIPGKPYSAGPFAIVWKLARGVTISSEYWAYRLAALTITDSPTRRWPALAVGPEVPPDSPVRAGLDAFVAVCMACHRFDGAGEGEQGPDLGRPTNPVDVFRPAALRQLIRDPASVRHWPGGKMPGFGPDSLSDADLDAIIAWLGYKARRR